jgi:glycine dehydrogenase subunit 1
MPSYVSHTDEEIAGMLDFLGLDSLDQLFDVVPAALRLAGGLDLPDGLSEPDAAELERRPVARVADIAALAAMAAVVGVMLLSWPPRPPDATP